MILIFIQDGGNAFGQAIRAWIANWESQHALVASFVCFVLL
jgi:hypothetical protein